LVNIDSPGHAWCADANLVLHFVHGKYLCGCLGLVGTVVRDTMLGMQVVQGGSAFYFWSIFKVGRLFIIDQYFKVIMSFHIYLFASKRPWI